MARMKDRAVSVKDFFMMNPADIEIREGFNVRQPGPDLEEHIQDLMASIREVGVLEPLTIRMEGEHIWLLNGECRLTAVRRLLAEGTELRAVPCRTEDAYVNEADRTLALLTRNSGKPLTPLEAGMVFKRLIAYGWSAEDVAKRSGKSCDYVRRLLNLSTAPEAVLDSIRKGEISSSCAVAAIRDHGPEKAADIIQEARKKDPDKKVTPKSLPPARGHIEWSEVGPVMKSMLEQIIVTSGKERDILIADAKEFLGEEFG